MKDKEKQIEEMARTFCPYGDNAIIHQSCELCKQVLNGDCDCFRNAKKLYNKLFPKDSVVLSREEKQEYENLVKLLIYDKPIKSRVYEFIKDTKEQASKETAEEILNAVVGAIDNGTFSRKSFIFMMNKVYGVDIKE
jgi:hypothetical protein